MIAAIEGNLLFLLIIAIIGVINWLSKKAEEKQASQKPPPGPAPQRGELSSEEERMRRFLEALGVPTDQQPPPPAKPRPAPAAPKPLPTIVPRGEIASGHGELRETLRKAREKVETLRPKAEVRPVPKSPPQLPRRPLSLDEEEAPAVPVAKLHLPELRTPEVPEFQTVSSHVTAIPFEAPVPAESDAYKYVPDKSAVSQEQWRAFLRSPRDLRAAIVLREVLGPPRGLQTAGSLPTFP